MKKTNKLVFYLLSFLVPVGILTIISVKQGFCPFGSKTMFIMDMKGQYLEFFASLRNLFGGDDSIFYSWSRSMGGNYLGLFAYYIASPLSFITVFFPLEKMTVAIWLLTVLKIGLCGISFLIFAVYIYKKYHDDVKYRDLIILLALSVSYALISYNMVYSMCLMWLDGVILLPLVIMGVEKILEGSKGVLYTLAITSLFICNYYTGYMAGIFTGIFFVYRLITVTNRENMKKQVKNAIVFTVDTFLAVGMSSPIILPVVKDLMLGKMSMTTYTPDTVTNFKLTDILFKLLNGKYDSITNTGLPSIYCGIFGLLCAVLFFMVREVKLREKIGAVMVIALLVCSFYFTKLDIAWHGFKYPTWFPYRYAFVFSFFILYMACRGALIFSKIKNMKASYIIGVAFMVISVLDMGINGNAMFNGLDNEFGYDTKETYVDFVKDGKKLVADIKASDKGFYRVNQSYEYSKNDAMLLGYNGMAHYSSTFNANVNTFTSTFGIAQSYIWNSGYGDTPLLDSLFNVKYIMTDRKVPDCYSIKNYTDSGKAVYTNNMCIPLIYGSYSSDMNPQFTSGNPFENQNMLFNNIAGTNEQYFENVPYESIQSESELSYSFVADSSNPVYMYIRTPSVSWADIYVNDEWIGNYFSTETICNHYLGTFETGQAVVVKLKISGAAEVSDAYISKLNMDKFYQSCSMLQNNGMDIKKHKSGSLSGSISIEENQRIMTSIPYDEGWIIKVDGKKVEPEKFAGTFITFNVDSGNHDISMSYVSPGFKLGFIICIISLIAFIVFNFPIRIPKHK